MTTEPKTKYHTMTGMVTATDPEAWPTTEPLRPAPGVWINGTLYPITEMYRNRIISVFAPNSIAVIDPKANTIYFVGLDDSKATGARVSRPVTIFDAKRYIANLAGSKPLSTESFTARLRAMEVGDTIAIEDEAYRRRSQINLSHAVGKELGRKYSLKRNIIERIS